MRKPPASKKQPIVWKPGEAEELARQLNAIEARRDKDPCRRDATLLDMLGFPPDDEDLRLLVSVAGEEAVARAEERRLEPLRERLKLARAKKPKRPLGGKLNELTKTYRWLRKTETVSVARAMISEEHGIKANVLRRYLKG
ncbi:MAG TPA: hypothetical protein VML91_03270 [Burkholderiales bacterium]|nr:hypothetical protein [Burkholderiales bacterium]